MTVTKYPAILWQNEVPDATITLEAGTLDASSDVTKIASPLISGSNAVQFTSATVTCRATWATAPSVYDYVALVGVGGATDATVKWTIDDDIDAGGTINWDSGTIDAFDFTRPEITGTDWPLGGRHVISFPPASATGGELQFVYDPGTSPSSKTIGALRAGRLWQSDRHMQFRWRFGVGFPRTWDLTVTVDRDHSTELHSVLRTIKDSTRVLFVPRPLSTEEWIREVIYCRVSNPNRVTESYRNFDLREITLEFEEVLT